MEKKPLVSVIMPCYNHEKYVSQAIESVLNQTYKNLELIVADNGSLDNSYEVIKQYEGRIKIIRLEKNDQMRCGKMLFKEATGEYLALMTSDDWWFPEKIAVQMERMLNDKSIKACITYGVKCNEDMEPIDSPVFQMLGDKNPFEIFRFLYENGNCLAMPSAVFETEQYRKLVNEYSRGYKQLADYDWWLALAGEKSLSIVPQVLMKFRWHVSEGTVNESAPTLENLIRDKNEIIEIAFERFDKLADDFFMEAFSDVLINKKPQSHVDVLCEKFLYLFSSEETLYTPEVARRFYHTHFGEMYDELVDKYNFSAAGYHTYIAEKSLVGKYIEGQVSVAQLADKRKADADIIGRMYSAIRECEGKLSLLPPEISGEIEKVGNVAEKLADICDSVGNTAEDATYFQVANEIKSIVECINGLGKYMLFADIDVESEEWKNFSDIVQMAGSRRIDLCECVSEYLRIIKGRVEHS